MNRWKIAFVLSLLVNAGVLAGVLLQSLRDEAERFPGLPAYLELTESQRREWESLEKEFLKALGATSRDVAVRRERLIRAVLIEKADPAAIEAERAAIAAVQSAQQQRILAQLAREREILDPAQRARLAELLLKQAQARALPIERLHGE